MDLNKMIEIRESYANDLQWTVWYLEESEDIEDKKKKIATLKEIIQDIKKDVLILKGRRLREYESENQKN